MLKNVQGIDDALDTYELLASDALNWLERAEGLRLSADVIYAAFEEVMPLSQTLPGIREKKLAFIQSYMLLTAIAFENLLKGLAVIGDPAGWRRLQDDGGHGISTFAASVTALSDEERDLLQRLQEYLVWAGRYNVPTKAARYAAKHGMRTLRSTDPLLIARLFERLARLLHDRVRKSI
jgi:hypothetical protein